MLQLSEILLKIKSQAAGTKARSIISFDKVRLRDKTSVF